MKMPCLKHLRQMPCERQGTEVLHVPMDPELKSMLCPQNYPLTLEKLLKWLKYKIEEIVYWSPKV